MSFLLSQYMYMALTIFNLKLQFCARSSSDILYIYPWLFSANCLTSLQPKLVCHRAQRCNSPQLCALITNCREQEKLLHKNWFSRVLLSRCVHPLSNSRIRLSWDISRCNSWYLVGIYVQRESKRKLRKILLFVSYKIVLLCLNNTLSSQSALIYNKTKYFGWWCMLWL